MAEQQLFRGYLPDNNNSGPRLQSSVDLEQLASQKADPHASEYAEKLIWATPEKDFARGVVIMRFLIKLAISPEYRQAISKGERRLPTIVSYQVGDDTQMFDATGRTLEPIAGQPATEVVLDRVDPQSLKLQVLNRTHLGQLEKLLTSRGSDTLSRAVLVLERRTGKPLRGSEEASIFWPKMDKLTFSEQVKYIFDFYQQQGLSAQEIEDALAQGLFSSSISMRKMVDTLAFSDQAVV